MASCIVDTYAWLAYLDGEGNYKQAIEENVLKTPAIVLAELARVLARRGIRREKADELLALVEEKSVVLPLEAASAKKAGEAAELEKLHLVDAIIYSCASNDEPLLTGDEHFKGKKNVLFIA